MNFVELFWVLGTRKAVGSDSFDFGRLALPLQSLLTSLGWLPCRQGLNESRS